MSFADWYADSLDLTAEDIAAMNANALDIAERLIASGDG